MVAEASTVEKPQQDWKDGDNFGASDLTKILSKFFRQDSIRPKLLTGMLCGLCVWASGSFRAPSGFRA